MIHIIQHGMTNPEKTHICPTCGNHIDSFSWKSCEVYLRNMKDLMCGWCPPEQVPTFKCDRCGAKWQWLPDPVKNEDDQNA